ncbi:lysozyme inhibitor LprI family protein [Paraburkholderia nemoris]|uniref:lysozyme inhibitor LprI family protein n=1 Tax=Paraburkholderia nemoris TaxID=2793076 RepID=UPI001B237A12|nr:lysozyme inhibitor LprI family protein [Paraburkholderia nemoris]CAE6792949.1 hypothetical protein LMG22931_05041 [Paraburkholderia nemoris]
MRFVRFASVSVSVIAAMFAVTAAAESTLTAAVVAANLDAATHRSAVLLQVTDKDASKDEYGRIITTLPAVSNCTAPFKDDVYSRVGTCYAVRVFEDGIPVEAVKVRVLDTADDKNWAVLSWDSRSAQPSAQRSIRVQIGVPEGLYNDNRDEDFKLGSLSKFDPANPYAWLYAGADRGLNLSYRTLLSARSGKQADNFRNEQREWIRARDTSCNEALEGEVQRCQWVATYNRLRELRDLSLKGPAQ